jgi:HEAT repeat protein
MTRAADDPRSVADLIEAAFESDNDAAWEAVAALQWRGSAEVLDRVLPSTRSSDAFTRGRAADILGQLGIPERTFPDQCFDAVLPLLSDHEWEVVFAAILALQHINASRAAPHIIPFAQHEHGNIRYAVAFALGGIDTAEAIDTLLALMKDADAEVRNWSTFGLGQLSDADTDGIRTALAARLADADQDVRYEAVIGLGRRRDGRVLGMLKTLLEEDGDDLFARQAAAKFLGLDASGDIKTSDLLGALAKAAMLERPLT